MQLLTLEYSLVDIIVYCKLIDNSLFGTIVTADLEITEIYKLKYIRILKQDILYKLENISGILAKDILKYLINQNGILKYDKIYPSMVSLHTLYICMYDKIRISQIKIYFRNVI